jgi:Bacterial Ig-like domain (group 2)/Two component regulator propeller
MMNGFFNRTDVLAITMFAMIVIIAFSCKKDSIAPAGITITPASLQWYVGANDTLKSAISPSNASGRITWSSGNPDVANVNQSGVVTGVSAGTAEITATTDNQLKAVCPVTITRWTNYNTSNSGLINDTVYAIAIDAQGNKWIGTEKGLSKFNNIEWTNYNTSGDGLVKSRVVFIAIDSKGNKWIGDDLSGVSKFDGTHWTVSFD